MSDSQNTAGGTASAPNKRTGLTVLLYVLLIAAIVAALWAMSVMRKVESIPTVQRAVAIFPQLEEMKDLTQSQIEQRASFNSAADALESPHALSGRFVVIDGEVQGEESTMVNQNMQAANMTVEAFEGDGYKSYVLDEGLVLVDITGERSQFGQGDIVRGFGMLLVVDIKDIWELPFVGPDLKSEFGDIEGTAESVVFLFSKGVKQISAEEMTPSKTDSPAALESAGGEAAAEDDSAATENPCAAGTEEADAAANPCGSGADDSADGAAPDEGESGNPCAPDETGDTPTEG